MRRRGNKSNKVPNVKLRPPQVGSSSRTQHHKSACYAQDSQFGSDDTSILDYCPRPFKGLVICATGIVDKPALFKQAIELGATSVSAFTDRVTHLIGVDHGGAKYMCALERKIPILRPSWINESYQIWLRGDDVDVQKSVEKHRLPIFSGVVLSPSGITDITRRTQIHQLLTQQEGEYVKNLERPVRVTHLLCSGDEETEKMRYAEKFNNRGEANIHLVWEEWFWDSLEFGGRFNEEKYQVRHPRPERKSLPEAAVSAPASGRLSEQDPNMDLSNLNSNLPADPRSQNQDDNEEEEMASVRQIPAVTLQLWESLLKKRGYGIMDGELLRSPSKSEALSKSRVQNEGRISPISTPPRKEQSGGSVISQFRRSNAFAPILNDPRAPRQPFRRTLTAASISTDSKEVSSQTGQGASTCIPAENDGNSLSASGQPAASTSTGIFVGLKFRALGEARSGTVRAAIESRGGMMVLEGEADENVDFIVVRLVSGSKLYRDEPDELEKLKYRTECWLERCIFEDRLCPPQEHISFKPLEIDTPVPGAENINISFSGLDQSEACWIRRLVRALGINLATVFSRRSTHLLCPSKAGAKFEKACEWRIPVVSMAWLVEMATTKAIPPVSGYLAHVPVKELESVQESRGAEVLNMTLQKNGATSTVKGKEKEADSTMNNLTNDCQLDNPMSLAHAKPLSDNPRNARSVALLSQQDHSRIVFTTLSLPAQHRHPPNSPSRSIEAMESKTKPNSATSSANDGTSAVGRPSQAKPDELRNRVPSSMSPSPMKVPQNKGGFPVSPTKVSNEVTKALQDSITSLLGKRMPPPEDETASRTGKRTRPHRSKVPSRHGPGAQFSEVAEVAAVSVSGFGEPLSQFELYDEVNIDDGDGQFVEESMRVMYEDPGQRDEKKRLMSLLESQTEEVKPSCGRGKRQKDSSVRTRRSTRIAGF